MSTEAWLASVAAFVAGAGCMLLSFERPALAGLDRLVLVATVGAGGLCASLRTLKTAQ